MYQDGTTRDPSAIAALRGIFVNRGESYPLAVPRPDVEGTSSSIAEGIAAWLAANTTANYTAGTQLLDGLANIAESSQTQPLVVPVSGSVRELQRSGDSAGARARLVALLQNLAGPLEATRLGAETGPGVCSFPAGNTSQVCHPPSCMADTDYGFFTYSPPTTHAQGNCWTVVAGTPTPGGTLHYCKQQGATLRFRLGGTDAHIGVPGEPPCMATVAVAHKSGPDCGEFIVHGGAGTVKRVDTYAADVSWATESLVASGINLASEHEFVLGVEGTHSAASTDSWVQIVAVKVTRSGTCRLP